MGSMEDLKKRLGYKDDSAVRKSEAPGTGAAQSGSMEALRAQLGMPARTQSNAQVNSQGSTQKKSAVPSGVYGSAMEEALSGGSTSRVSTIAGHTGGSLPNPFAGQRITAAPKLTEKEEVAARLGNIDSLSSWNKTEKNYVKSNLEKIAGDTKYKDLYNSLKEKESQNFFTAAGDRAAQALKSVGSGFLNTMRYMSIMQEQDRVNNDPLTHWAEGNGLIQEGFVDESRKLSEDREKELTNQIRAEAEQKAEKEEALLRKQSALSDAEKTAAAWTGGAAQVAANAAAGVAHPYLSMAVMGGQVFGNSIEEAVADGETILSAGDYAMLNTVKELAIEKIAGGIPGMGEGVLSDSIGKAVEKAFGSRMLSKAVTRLVESIGEGGEEVAADMITPYIKRMTYDKNAAAATTEELFNSFGGGMVASLLLGIPVDMVKAITGKSRADITADAKNELLEQGIAPDKAEKAALDLVDAAYAEMKEEGISGAKQARAAARDAVDSFRPMPVFDKDGNVKNTDIQKAAPEGGMTAKQAGRAGLTDPENLARYRAEIDGVFDGSMESGQEIVLGATPALYFDYGASDLPLHMTQSTAMKIAYPKGYPADRPSGKHNLGIPALKRLPQQLADPVAILRSNTQKNSLVVLTEWNNKNGDPVIIPLHLDKQGAVTMENQVVSAYGKGEVAALLGENNQNVLYTKDNKSIDQLLSERLQLPEAMADDTLVNHSIAQGNEESKPIYPVFDKDGNVTNGYGQSTQEKRLFDYFREKNPDASDETIRDMVQWRIAEQKIEDGVPLEEAQPAALREFTAAVEQTANTTIRYGERTDSGEAVGELGSYDRGANTIWINPRIATKASVLKSVMHHELIHRIEGSSFYDAIADMALKSRFGTAEGAAIENAVTDMQQSRAEQGERLSRQRAKQEVVAEIMQELIDSEERLQRAVTEAPRAGEGLLRAVRNMIELVKTFAQADSGNRLGAVQELRRLQAIEKNLVKALSEARIGNLHTAEGELQFARLTEDDLPDYLNAGTRKNKNKLEALARGDSVILTTEEQITDYIKKAIAGEDQPTVAYGKVSKRLAEDVLRYSKGKIDITDAYMELVGDAIRHAYQQHSSAKQAGDIGLSSADFERIPQYLDSYDELIYAIRYQSGSTHIAVGKQIAGGHAVMIDVVSASRGAVQFKNMIGVSEGKYQTQYAEKYKRNIPNTEGSESSNNSSRDGNVSSDINVPQKDSDVNLQSMPGNEKNTQRAGEAGGDYEFDAEDFAGWQNRYDEALEQYGAIPEGENAVRDVPVPKRMDGQTHVRRGARTVIESEYTPDEMVNRVKQAVAEDAFSYSRISNDGAIRYADRMIAEHGFEGAMEKWRAVVGGEGIAKVKDLVLGETLYQLAAKNGETELAMQIAAELTAEATAAGQTVQAMRIMKKATPAGRLYALEKVVNKLNGEYASKIDSGKMKTITIPAELAEQLLRAQTKGEIVTAQSAIEKAIAAQIPATRADKWNTWRYFAMLSNPRTHVRNVLGNVLFGRVVDVKNGVAAAMERFIPQDQRTKAILTPKDSGLRNFARSDFAEMKDVITGGGKMNPTDQIKSQKQVFQHKWLDALTKMPGKLLEAEDAWALRPRYEKALAGFLKARGIADDMLSSPEAQKVIAEGRAYAIREARRATFRDASAVASVLSKLENTNAATKLIGGGLLPFTKTPINIAKRGVEYSPAGLVKGAVELAHAVKNGEGTAQAIDSLAAGVTGTSLAVLGYFLASLGLVSGAPPEDEKEKEFEELQGDQYYAWNTPDGSYTIDWAAPAAIPFFIGVEIFESLQNSGTDYSAKVICDAIVKMFEPLNEMSMLQGVNRAIASAGYGEGQPVTNILTGAIADYLGQAIPTPVSALARTIDGTRRSNYYDKNSPYPKAADKAMQDTLRKLPVFSQQVQPYVDEWGREEREDNIWRRAAENFLSPGYYSKRNTTAADKELARLYQATGDRGVLPGGAGKYITVDSEREYLTAEEYTRFAKVKGKRAYQLVNKLIGSAAYKSARDTEKAAMITDAYTYAAEFGKKQVKPGFKMTSWVQKANAASNQERIPVETTIILRNAVRDMESLHDADGNAVANSKSLKIRAEIDRYPELSKAQRKTLYEMFGVGKNVQKMSDAKAERELMQLEKKYS